MSNLKRAREEQAAGSGSAAQSVAAASAAHKERDNLVSQVEMQVIKQQRAFDALSAALERIRSEETKEKQNIEVAFGKKKQQQVIAPRRALLDKIKGFWPAVFMKVTSDDNCPLRIQGSSLDFPIVAHLTDFVCAPGP